MVDCGGLLISGSKFRSCAAALFLWLTCAAADAACLVDPANRGGPLLHDVERAPKEVMETARSRLAANPPPEQAGWLWASIALANLLLDQSDQAGDAAEKGLSAIRSLPMAAARPQLEVLEAEVSGSEADARTGILRLSRLRNTLQPGSPADICTLATIANLQHVTDRPQEATRSITTAYRMASRSGLRAERTWTAMLMGAVLKRAHDDAAAHSVLNEAIALARGGSLPITLSNLLYQQGLYRIDARDYTGALRAFDEANGIARRLQGAESAAYIEMGRCEASLELGWIERARSLCGMASDPLAHSGSAKKIALLNARIAMADDHPRIALPILNGILDGQPDVATSTILSDALKLRAEAHAATGNKAAAYDDLTRYAARLRKYYADVLEKQTAELRARLLTDREAAQNQSLRNQLRLETEHGQAQRRQTILMVTAACVIMLMMAALVVLSRWHQRRLGRLADTDPLTGLPNRGAIQRRATQKADDLPLSVAVLDLDHFKALNDRFGHAAGDTALQCFADTARAALRENDVIGRWGGEEFLVLLPRTSAGDAVGIVERVRAALAADAEKVASGWPLTFSAGIAASEDTSVSLDRLVAAADAALYRAKAAGRNQTLLSEAADYRPRGDGVAA
jgi:diguanylate cyclase (GGDEF)-like protein